MPLQAGRRVGPYEILSTIGSGGMGTVYLARDSRLHRRVALKFIQADPSAEGDEAVPRLLHEARAASALNHPNVCQVYDVGGEGAESWIAMEYVEGRSLSALVQPSGLPAHEVIRLGLQIAEALSHAHERGILHRDLKTANIVCDSSGKAKILDFGIAQRLPRQVAEELSTTQVPGDAAFAGTLAYMPPEVIRGEGQDERSDLWSLGVVIYEVATGRLPFGSANAFDVATAIMRDPPAPLPRDVPAPFAAILARLLAKSPSDRYQSASEAAAALELVAKGDAPRTASRRALVFIGLAVAMGAIALVLWLWGQDRPLSITQQRLLSEGETDHRSPAYSPDGSLIAFTAPDAIGVEQVWVRNLASGTPIQATRGTAQASRPRWLPNGRLLYAADGQGLWVIPALGGSPTRVFERGRNPDVSRDGTRIVFETGGGRDAILWTAASDGSNVRRISGVPPPFYSIPMTPAISPDGTQVVYFRAEAGPNGDFWAIPSVGGTPRQLTFDLREGGWPTWTPDGNHIVFSSARAGSRTLWQVRATGGQPMPLTTGAGEDDQPAISGIGRQLAYTNVRNTWELTTMTLASGEEKTLLRRGLEILFPMFSPDGRRITYFGRADEAVAIFVVDSDGANQRQLTAGKELNHQPRWGPTGEDIYFFQVRPSPSFRRLPAVGGQSTEFRPWIWETQTAPYFDPTGRFIAYARRRPPGATTAQPDATVIHELATGMNHVWPPPYTRPSGWLPDGVSILGWQHDPDPGRQVLVICRVADRSCRAIGRGRAPRWSANDSRIYFLRPESGVERLWSVGIDGTDERPVATLGTFRAIDLFFDVSRDGVVVWAPFLAGRRELWTAGLSR